MDILDKIKSQSKEEGLRKYYEEKEERKKIQEDLEKERDDRASRKNKKKNELAQTIFLIFDLIIAVCIFCVVFFVSLFSNCITAIILGLVAVGSFWGLARNHNFYEQWKNKILASFIEYIFEKVCGNL